MGWTTTIIMPAVEGSSHVRDRERKRKRWRKKEEKGRRQS
jgi:hypothetical protein